MTSNWAPFPRPMLHHHQIVNTVTYKATRVVLYTNYLNLLLQRPTCILPLSSLDAAPFTLKDNPKINFLMKEIHIQTHIQGSLVCSIFPNSYQIPNIRPLSLINVELTYCAMKDFITLKVPMTFDK